MFGESFDNDHIDRLYYRNRCESNHKTRVIEGKGLTVNASFSSSPALSVRDFASRVDVAPFTSSMAAVGGEVEASESVVEDARESGIGSLNFV